MIARLWKWLRAPPVVTIRPIVPSYVSVPEEPIMSKVRLYTHGLASLVGEIEIGATMPPLDGLIWGGRVFMRTPQGDYCENAPVPGLLPKKRRPKKKR